MKIYNNIDLIQINLKEGKMYLPENVDFKDKEIDTIGILTTLNGYSSSISPFDNTLLEDESLLESLYLTLYDDNNNIIAHDVQAVNDDAQYYFRFKVGSKLSLSQSYIYSSTSVDPTKCILLYVCYGTKEEDDTIELPKRAITIHIDSKDRVIKLQPYIENYIKRNGYKIRGLEAFGVNGSNNFYLSLREKGGRVFRFVNSCYFLSPAFRYAKRRFLIDEFDVDFNNSFISNAEPIGNSLQIDLTFYY